MWYKNEIKGEGIKRFKDGFIEIGGIFDKGQINGKGFKRWRINGKIHIYRGTLIES